MKTSKRFLISLIAVLAAFLMAASCSAPSDQAGASTATTAQSQTNAGVTPTPAGPSPRATDPPAAPTATTQPTSTAVPTASPVPAPSPAPASSATGATGTGRAPGQTVAPRSTAEPSQMPAAPPPPPSTPSVQTRDFSGTAAYQHVLALAQTIGSRPGGTEAAQRAAAYIEQQFEAAGYQAELRPFTVSSFQERSSRLLVTRPQQHEASASALVYSGSGSVEGELVAAGLGRPSDFQADAAKGRVALVDRGAGITFQSKVEAAVAAGASAVIIANDRPGDLRGSLSKPAPVPVIAVSQSDGERLRELLRQGPTAVRLDVDVSTETRAGQNVVASSPSPETGRKRVVIGAHYDSVSAGPGANDNASGVSTILELARAMKDREYPFDVTFVAFGDEEIGLVGSRAFVDSLSQQERTDILAMLNFDMVGVGDRMEFGGEPGLVSRALRIAADLGQAAGQVSLGPNQSSDHASFSDAGIRSIFFYRSDDPNYHTRRDTADHVSTEHLEAAGDVALRLLDTLGRTE